MIIGSKRKNIKMNVLFLTLSNIENIEQRGIYTDLIRELAARGVNIYTVCSRQKRMQMHTELVVHNKNTKILKVMTGNITQTKSTIEKGLSSLQIEGQYISAINKYFKNIRFDMVMYSTPPISYRKIVKYFKKRNKSISYLILKDIFPQNAVDIGMLEKKGLLWRYFRYKEINLYKNSDIIGCMSQANLDYIQKHNKYLDKSKLEIFPNAIKPIERIEERKKDFDLLSKYDIPVDSSLFLYGGNLGKPQGIDFLLDVADNFYKVNNGHLLIVGNGTEYDKKYAHFKNRKPKNASLFEGLPKEEYDRIVSSADVGLIFLDRRFTIPNFPSRLTSYMENSLPILAATDTNTDIKDVLHQSNSGLWCESGDLNAFLEHAQRLASDAELRKQMGINGRIYLEKNYDISKTVDILLKHLDKGEKLCLKIKHF